MTDGKVGMETQCLGLAEAMGLEPVIKRISITKPWRWLPSDFIPDPIEKAGPKGDALAPPWPDILISSGRKTVAPAVAIRRAAQGKTLTIQIQNPQVDFQSFDFVMLPEHDLLDRGQSEENVVRTLGALGRATPERLKEAAAQFAPRYADLPRPRIAVLIGGNNRAYRLTRPLLENLLRQLKSLTEREKAGLMVTASRRTSPANIKLIEEGFAALPADLWDGTGDNPYFGMLGLADAVIVTSDSVNMVSEAGATGKPVHVVDLEGGSPKFLRFHSALRQAGITRPFTGVLEQWDYQPLAETRRAAEEIIARIARQDPHHLIFRKAVDK